ncbi:MAG: zinc ribbon domain-containing protein [bacterium]|nr:zinc ribbon domain-containing protein [bacterium]
MALIKCQNCGKNISDKANRCPHCDFSYVKENKKKPKIFIPIMVGIATFVLIMFAYMFLF